MIEREKHINTIIENLILSQKPITDSIKQNTGNSTIVKIPDKHKNKNNTETSKILDSSNRASEIEVLEESKMAGLEKRSGDFAGAEMPSLSVLPIINVTPFSGKDQDAGRWIAVLESKFIQAGFNSLEDVPGWMWVKAVWMNATTDAALWMDSTPHIRKITDKVKTRRPIEISGLERDLFTDEFTRRFELVVAPENEPQQQKMVNELRQEKDESLRDYFSRAQGILRVIGADDSSEYRGVASSANKFVIEMMVDRFVLGIYDEELNARSVDRGAASSGSLHQAFQVIQGCQTTMADQARQNEMWQQMYKAKAFDFIQENPSEVNAVVNDFAQFNVDSVRRGNFRRPFVGTGVSSALPGRILPTETYSTQETRQQLILPALPPPQSLIDDQQYKNNSGYQGPPQRESWRHRKILRSKSQENMARATASQVISGHVQSSWPIHGTETPYQVSESNEIPVNFDRAQMIERSRSPPTKTQPVYTGKTVKFEEFLSQADASDQSEPNSRVSSSGNAVDCFTAEYFLDEPITCDQSKKVETTISKLKIDEPIASEVLLTAHVNELLARKRQRVEELLNDEDVEPRQRHGSFRSSTENNERNPEMKKRREKGKRIIRGRKEQGDVNYKNILERAEFKTNVLEFAQASTSAQNQFKKLLTGENSRRKKRNPEVFQAAIKGREDKEVRFESQHIKDTFQSIQPHQYKSFQLKTGFTHADQGADVCLISASLAKALAVVHKILPVPMRFGTADGGTTVAKHFTSIQIGVAEIWRKVDVLILPQVKNDPHSLLLGLPWLYQVNARIDIPTFSLRIGDRKVDGRRVEILTTRFKLGKHQNIRLAIEDGNVAKLIQTEMESKNKESILDPFEDSSNSETSVTESDESESEYSSEEEERILEEAKIRYRNSGKDIVTDVTKKRQNRE
ncbi:hypothetical protein EV44_g3923 [Erysiphe necator]|uniref:Retrotransposon gag domain-containing protein n=1 Tax=Uncinula necator TaxID=52586 RepID=A0A0B1P6Q7_UNCNE|nr:hypothetical protein EV44_g3923 [Erysiphe necator]